MSSLFQAPPDGWQRTTLRHLVQGPKNGAWGSEAGEDEIDAVCVRVADFDWSRLTLKLEDPTTRSFKKQQFKNLQLRRGDIVIEKSGGGEKTPVGRVVSFDEDVDAVTSNFVARIRPHASVLNRFFLYLLAAHYMSGYSHQFIKQNTGIQNLDDANLFRSDVWIPHLATQRQIADFLDRETARIDLLIEKKQKLVALLGDHWNRFTFDLFSLDTPTRFELDKSQWQHKKLKFVSPQVTVGIVVTPAAYYTDGGVPAIRGTNIRPMHLRPDDMVSITDEGHRINRKSAVQEGDLVVVRTGQPGTAAVVPKALDGANCIDVILIKKTNKYLSDLLAHFLNSSAAKVQYSSGSSGAIQQHFNVSIASNIVVPVPPLREQDRVLAILRQEGPRVKNLTSTLQTSIDRLKEYRSALITAAVTGQIDPSSHTRSGTIDRQLDAIQEEMSA